MNNSSKKLVCKTEGEKRKDILNLLLSKNKICSFPKLRAKREAMVGANGDRVRTVNTQVEMYCLTLVRTQYLNIKKRHKLQNVDK